MSRGATRRRELTLLAAALLAGLALLEVGSAVIRSTVLGPPAPRTHTTAPAPQDPATAVFAERYVSGMALHPYLGFALDPAAPRVNAYGFVGLDPLEAAPGEVVIGVFGGSLATELAQRGGLDAALAGIAPGRSIRLLDLGMGGYKQPQQLLLLTYLLAVGARFDVVINLDGFNEVALPFAENARYGVNPFYPRSWNLYAKLGFDRELALRVGEVERLALERERWAQRLTGHLGSSQVVKLVHALVDRRLYNAWHEATEALAKEASDADGSVLGPPLAFEDPAAFFAALTQVWSQSSIQMASLCREEQIAYFHFLQPNQYVAGSKPMGEEERRVALARGSFPFANAVRAGYPGLVQVGASLAREGVAFTDLTEVFRDVTRPLYADRCCHVNDDGYRLLAKAIAREVERGLPAQSSTWTSSRSGAASASRSPVVDGAR